MLLHDTLQGWRILEGRGLVGGTFFWGGKEERELFCVKLRCLREILALIRCIARFRNYLCSLFLVRRLVSQENRVWKFVVYACTWPTPRAVAKVQRRRSRYEKFTRIANLLWLNISSRLPPTWFQIQSSMKREMLARCETSWLRKLSLSWRKLSVDFSTRVGQGGGTFD